MTLLYIYTITVRRSIILGDIRNAILQSLVLWYDTISTGKYQNITVHKKVK